MTLEHLRLFRDIVQERSISTGAKRNGLSQGGASLHVKDLEESLGVALLDRSVRPFELTRAGELYYDFCRDVLRRREEFEAAIERERHQVEGRVRIAAIYSVEFGQISCTVKQFSERFPAASATVQYRRPELVYQDVLEDQADLGLVSYPNGSKEMTVIPWREEEMVITARAGTGVIDGPHVPATSLHGRDFVAFDPGLPIQKHIEKYLRDRNVEVNAVAQFDNIPSMLDAVEAGVGVTIVPEPVVRQRVQAGLLEAARLDDGVLTRPVGIIHRRKKVLTSAIRGFIDLLRESAASHT